MSEEQWYLNGKRVVKQQMLSKANHQIIDGVSVTLEASFGCLQQPIRKNCVFVNDDTLMFISGKHIVLYDIIRKRQTYIMKSADDESVNALNFHVTGSGKLLIALAFKSTNKILPTVKVYNRKKKRFYQCVHSHLLPGSNVFEITFLSNGKHLISASKTEDGYGLSLFHVSKEVSISYLPVKGRISMMEVCDEKDFLVIGPTYFALYRYAADVNGLELALDLIDEIGLEGDDRIVGCCYCVDKKTTVVVTSRNHIVLLRGDKCVHRSEVQTQVHQMNNLIQQIQMQKKQQQQPADISNASVSTLTRTSKGFILGMMGRAALQVYEIEDFHPVLIGTYFIKDEHIYGIHQIHLAEDEMYAALTVIQFNRSAGSLPNLTCEQILEQHGGKLELFTFNLAIVEALKSVEKDPFEPLFEKGVHRGQIYNLAITPMRSLMASVCEDRTIKFWDYSNDFRELFSHQFHETPLSVAIHPLSYQCVVGFKDGLRFYFILDDDIKPVHTETTKACNSLCYSEGGHILAAANGNQIQLYNPLSYQMVQVLSNHQANLKELQFIERDSKLVSQCTYGILYVWNLLSMERMVEHAQKLNKYNCLHYDPDFDLVVGVSDQRLKVYNEKGQNLVLDLDTAPTQFSAICVSHRYNAIFFGTSQGSVRVYSYPFYHFNPKTMEYIEVPVHQLAVTQIRISPDNSFLISASLDGSIFFSKIKQFVNGQEITQLDLIARGDLESKVTNTFALNHLCLCSRYTMETRRDQLKELDYKLQNFKSDIDDAKEVMLNTNDHQLKEQRLRNENQLHQLREHISQTIQSSDMRINKLKVDTIELRKESKRTFERMTEEHSQHMLRLYAMRDELQDKLSKVKSQQDEQIKQVNGEYSQSIQQVDDEYCQKYQDLYQRFSDAMNNMKLDQKKFKEVLQQSERDYETYYKESQEQLQNRLLDHTEKTIALRAAISKNKKENARLIHRSEFLNNLIKDTKDQVEGLEAELEAYRKKHQNMSEDLKEKEKLINQREQQIKDFRMKNVHLQNFQKVYDYRVNTLKDEREPLMEHLRNMEKHVKNLYNELIEESGLKQQRKEEKRILKNDLRILKQQFKSALTVLSLSERKMETIRFSLKTLIESDTSQWREGLAELHQQIQSENQKAIKIRNPVFQETLKDMQKDPIQQQIDQSQQHAIYKELSSQKQFLMKKLQDVEQAVQSQLNERQEAYAHIQRTNGRYTGLIKQCNELRGEKIRLKEHLDEKNKEFREVKREVASLGFQIIDEDDDNPRQGTQFAKTNATGFTQLTRTPGTQSQQNFRKKVIRNLQ